jgi:hypothetical protein
MLSHFKMDFSVLHDIDAPKTRDGVKANPAYSVNTSISTAIDAARAQGAKVTYRCSCPNFERHHGMALPKKDKPFESWKAVRGDESIRKSVRVVFDELCKVTVAPEVPDEDGANFEVLLKAWMKAKGIGDPAFKFD